MLPDLPREPGEALRRYYENLYQRFGAQRWWPARTRMEVILGAILTQNTAWRNAALALRQLRQARAFSLKRLQAIPRPELESLIRPAGFYRQKAATILNFLGWLQNAHAGSLRAAFACPAGELRRNLLSIKGLGPETADAILLYAGRRPFFVADAYTRRVLARHNLLPAKADYAQAQEFLHQHLPREQALFNEFHALLVELGKAYCKSEEPQCQGCPLEKFLPPEGTVPGARRASLTPPASGGNTRPEAPRASV